MLLFPLPAPPHQTQVTKKWPWALRSFHSHATILPLIFYEMLEEESDKMLGSLKEKSGKASWKRKHLQWALRNEETVKGASREGT